MTKEKNAPSVLHDIANQIVENVNAGDITESHTNAANQSVENVNAADIAESNISADTQKKKYITWSLWS